MHNSEGTTISTNQYLWLKRMKNEGHIPKKSDSNPFLKSMSYEPNDAIYNALVFPEMKYYILMADSCQLFIVSVT